MLGESVEVIVDRPFGSCHPKYRNCVYPINYGYVPGVMAGDGEEQDAYIMGVHEPLEKFKGRVIAIIRRSNDNEDKWVVAPDGCNYSSSEIRAATDFVEQYFTSDLILWKEK